MRVSKFTLIMATLLFSFPAIAGKSIRATINMGTVGGDLASGFNSETAEFSFADQINNNFSDGTNPEVNSHFQRLQQDDFTARVKSWNVAKSGAKARDLNRQVTKLIRNLGYYDKLDYVTISIGVNDVCGWSRGGYDRSIGNYENFVTSALRRLIRHNRHIKINLVGLTNLYNSWSHNRDNYQCKRYWKYNNTCPALLGRNVGRRGRALFNDHQQGLNTVLSRLASRYSDNVKYSGDHYSSHTFSEEISSVDCFSPSVRGQWRISRSSWLSGWYN